MTNRFRHLNLLIALMFISTAFMLVLVPMDDSPNTAGSSDEVNARATDYIVSGELSDERHILGKGWEKIGKITMTKTAKLDVVQSAVVILQDDIDIYDDALFEIFARKIVIEGDINLYGRAKLRILQNEEIFVNGTIRMHDNATMDIEDIEITFGKRIYLLNNNSFNMSGVTTEFRGAMSIQNNSKVSLLEDTTVTWEPNTDLGDYESLLSITGDSNLTVESSSLIINPPQWAWAFGDPELYGTYNTSFIFTDNNAGVFFNNSHFACKLPGNVIAEPRHVTAGTILVTGSSRWDFIRTSIRAELNYTMFIYNASTQSKFVINHQFEGDPGPGNETILIYTRWFWLSSQRDGTVNIFDCDDIMLEEPGDTLFKPTSGFFFMSHSKVRGLLLPETIAKVKIESSYVHYQNYNKGDTQGKDYPIKVYDQVKGYIGNCTFIGTVNLGWSSLDGNMGLATPKLHFYNNKFVGNITTMANLEATFEKNDLSELIDFKIEGNTTINLIDQEDVSIHTITGAEIIPRLEEEFPENVTINAWRSDIPYLDSHSWDAKININLYEGSTIDTFEIDEPGCRNFIRLLNGSSIKNYHHTNDTYFNLTLVDPKKEEIPTAVDPAHFVDVNYILDATIMLNGVPHPNITVELASPDINGVWLTDENGKVVFEYTQQKIDSKGTTSFDPNGQLKLSYFGLELTESIKLDQGNTLELGLDDIVPPVVSEIEITPERFVLKKSMFVKAKVSDDDVRYIEEVILRYRIDGGSWKNVTMLETEPGVYQGSLPRQNLVTIEYYVVAKDSVGNVEGSDIQTKEVGDEETLVALILVVLFIVVFLVILFITFKNRLTVNKYLYDEYNKDRHPNLTPYKGGEKE